MTSYAGVLKILRFNWTWYASAVLGTLVGVFLLTFGALPGAWAGLVTAGLLVADAWLIASLAVSHFVYDRSPVARGAWLDAVVPASVRRVAIFHGGLNEASETVARILPAAAVQSFDFYDASHNGTASLRRARAFVDREAVVIAPDRMPLPNGALDLGLVVFAAHEIRRDRARADFFRELARVLAPTGRILVVEHLRDGWNFAAYGPGALHFLSRRTWDRSFSEAGLKLVSEAPCTPFVRVFELGRAS